MKKMLKHMLFSKEGVTLQEMVILIGAVVFAAIVVYLTLRMRTRVRGQIENVSDKGDTAISRIPTTP